MRYEHFIGLRYLMAKKRTQVVSIITLISICGVTLGVTAMIVVLSVMGGFKKDLKDKILGTKAHAVVTPAEGVDLLDPDAIAERIRAIDGVTGAEPFVQSDVMVSSSTNLSGVVLRGIHPKNIDAVSDLRADMVEGELEYLLDPKPLLDSLATERDKRIDEILKRVNGGRDELNDAKKALEQERKGVDPVENLIDELEEEGGLDADDAEMAGEDIMPPIFGDAPEDPFSDSEGSEDSMMPSIFGDPAEEAGDSGSGRTDASGYGEIPGLLIGPELAKSLQAELGTELNVVTPDGGIGPTGSMPRSRPFRVVGIFKTGMYEYDSNSAYTAFGDAQAFLNRAGASGIEVKTIDSEKAVAIADVIQARLGPTVEVLDWKEMNSSLFFALELEKIGMFVALLFIILVASFSIVAMLIMIVIEKGRDIAILKSMGVPDSGIRRIFIVQGLVIGAVGTGVGLLIGLAICWYLKVYGVPLNSEVYYISKLPVEINPTEILAVVLATLGISGAATIYPAYLASKLKPVDGLRYD
ncbi:ABC transporter permease [Bradymonas sediminis]|uniref:Uncharacterized protein n=1 Tax=Bradymonas sediminis TaxID=1548548 RepID=A0A2Z4FIU8_9DELT|nr:ABC transporter permease [Bradymonas sediminis]AWV88823.1 hypothetical protein DN745_05515 [Bradymonas sediminis]TDP71825.1 lipoprotein-releasing system permease protein [Bradymonas sediminis]